MSNVGACRLCLLLTCPSIVKRTPILEYLFFDVTKENEVEHSLFAYKSIGETSKRGRKEEERIVFLGACDELGNRKVRCFSRETGQKRKKDDS